ncbi:MAG: hypothetical protein ABIJ53_00645 [Verrucomicrobiota bacterium]
MKNMCKWLALKTATIIMMLVCLSLSQALTFGGSTDGTAEERRQYQQDRDRVVSLSEFLSPGKTNDLKTFENLADDLDKKWSDRNREYHARLLLEICEPLSSGSINDDRRYGIARKYALSALDKPDMIPLPLELELIGHVMTPIGISNASNTNDFSQLRKEDVAIRLHAWRRLINAIDPKWDPDEFIMGPNMILSPGVQDGGTSPDAIKDPRLRAEYEAAIQRNRQKSERHAEQYKLQDWLKRYPKRAEKYIVQAYSQPPFNLEELRQALDIYLTDKETKARILDAVEKSIEIQTKEEPKGEGGVISNASQPTTNQTAAGVPQIPGTGKTNDLLELLEIRANPDRPHQKPD